MSFHGSWLQHGPLPVPSMQSHATFVPVRGDVLAGLAQVPTAELQAELVSMSPLRLARLEA